MPTTRPVTLETLGCEFETECNRPDVVQSALNRRNIPWTVTHDASIETDAKIFNGLIALGGENLPDEVSYQKTLIGTEILSPILHLDEFPREIERLTSTLEYLGEENEGERSSIHFHISMGEVNGGVLKNIVRLARYMEKLFFQIGSAGYKFRGESNDAIYCRPITNFGPACVPYAGGGWVQVFSVKDLCDPTYRGAEIFWERYGDTRNHNDRYNNPARYSWINLLPLYPGGRSWKGTLEFRMLNKTLNPRIIIASANFCMAFAGLAYTSSFQRIRKLDMLGENSVFDKSISKEKLHDLLEEFASLDIEINQRDMTLKVLHNVIEKSPLVNLDDGFVKTHKHDIGGFFGNEYHPTLVPSGKIRNPKYVDIHVLRQER